MPSGRNPRISEWPEDTLEDGSALDTTDTDTDAAFSSTISSKANNNEAHKDTQCNQAFLEKEIALVVLIALKFMKTNSNRF